MKAAPNPKDAQDFQFKQSSIGQVCENLKAIPVACSLIVSDGKRGLLYVAHENKITVLKCNDESNNEGRIDYDLSYSICRLSISYDFSYLGVTFNRSTAHIYNAASLSKNSLELLHEIQVSRSSQNVFAYDLRWNPAVAGMFCTIASDHSIGSFQVKIEQKATVGVVALEKIQDLEAMCVAWSPKGKQLVIGCKNGNIVQLKPELKVARTIPGPSPGIGEVIAILWISNYQFCAAYMDVNERRVNILIVDAPKGETKASFTCYDDITYGMPEMEGEYFPRYYFDHVPEWNMIIAASSSSSEIAVLGSMNNGVNWEQWQLIDSGRAQLPLIRTAETYPVGMAIDKSPVMLLPWGPESTLPHPMPILHIFGTAGQIISFHMVNLLPNAPAICSPPIESVSIAPQSRVSTVPSELSFNMHPGVTSTPRPKQADVPIERPKVLPAANLFNDPARNLASFPAPAAPPPAPVSVQAPAAPVAQVELKIPKPRPEKIEQHSQKAEKRLSPVKEVSAPTPEKLDLDDSICWRAYREEQMHFEKELKTKLEPQVWEVGTEEERQKLITQCAQIDEFRRELRETTNSLSSEIAYLKALLLQSFAWLEETKSRNSASSNDTSRDRHDRSKIQELQRLVSYTQSQLLQAVKALDMQWAEHESQERSKIKIPSLEVIYQGLKRHSDIIAKEKVIIEQLHKKWKSLANGSTMSNLNRSIGKLNISSNASGSGSGVNIDGGVIEMRCKTIASHTRNFSKQKQMKLRDVLLQIQPRVIKPINPSPVQDKLEATLSSLASKSPIPTPPKQKAEKSQSERPAVSEPSRTVIAPAAPVPPVQKTTSVAQSPLASLNSIVAKIGTPPAEATTPPQTKTTPLSFSMGPFPPVFGNLFRNKFSLESNVSNQSSLPPVPSPAVSTTFPKVASISFGIPEQKTPEILTSAVTTQKETPPKTTLSFRAKDAAPAVQSPPSLLDTCSPESSSTTGMTLSKIEQPTAAQNQSLTSLGSGLSLSFTDSRPPATTNQQTVFSFASPASTTVTSKAATTTNIVPSGNIQSFSFVSKPIDPPDFPSTIKDAAPALQTSRSALDLSKMSMGLSPSSEPEKPAISLPSSTTISFGRLSMPTSTSNFGKASPATLVITSSQQDNKLPISLPAGTSIEKVPVIPATPVSSPFGDNSGLASSIFGGTSIFGGSASPSSFPPASSQPLTSSDAQTTATTTVDKVSTTSTTSIFSSPGTTAFPQVSAASTTAPPPSGFSTTGFGLNSLMSSLNFAKPPTTSPVSSAFGQTPITTVALASPSSPFSQPAAMPASSLVKVPPTTSATPSFFGNPLSTSNASVFGPAPATSTSSIFSGNLTSSGGSSPFSGASTTSMTPFGTPGSSIFSGAATIPAANVFGGGPSFPAPAAMPAAPAFGTASAFGTKPVFGSPTIVFGAAKPEFNSPFGSATFGNPGGFSAAATMAGSPPALDNASMGKVFGNAAGSTTFESLAGQNSGLSFSSLAQKSPSPEKPPSFSGGSSFNSWR